MMLHRLRLGDVVREKDGRHEGDIVASGTVSVRVKWRETGWLSDLDADDLEKVTT